MQQLFLGGVSRSPPIPMHRAGPKPPGGLWQRERTGLSGSPLGPGMPWQRRAALGVKHTVAGAWGTGLTPCPLPALTHAPLLFRQGDAGQGIGVREPRRYGASLSLSCCCAGVGTASECLKGLFYTLLLHKLQHVSALN